MDDHSMLPIAAIFGMEPHRDQEAPTAHSVGYESWSPAGKFTVTAIKRREENMGTYGLLWFDVYDGDRIALSMSAQSVAEVHYQMVQP